MTWLPVGTDMKRTSRTDSRRSRAAPTIQTQLRNWMLASLFHQNRRPTQPCKYVSCTTRADRDGPALISLSSKQTVCKHSHSIPRGVFGAFTARSLVSPTELWCGSLSQVCCRPTFHDESAWSNSTGRFLGATIH